MERHQMQTGNRLSKFQLLRILRKHVKLAEKRSVAYEQNKAAKFFIYLMWAFAVVYIIFIAIMLALIANDSDTLTPYEFFYGVSPFLLVADFVLLFLS